MKENISDTVITHKETGTRVTLAMPKVTRTNLATGEVTTYTSDELLLPENKEVLTELLEDCIPHKTTRRFGYKKDEDGNVLDTQGRIYATHAKLADSHIAYETAVYYTNIFKAAPPLPSKAKKEDKNADNKKEA